MHYYLKASALRDLSRLPKSVQKRIIKKLDFFIYADNPLQFAEKIKDFSLGGYRFRIGDYRVIFDIEKDSLIILVVGHRKDVYR